MIFLRFTFLLPLYRIPNESLPSRYEHLQIPDATLLSFGDTSPDDDASLNERSPEDAVPNETTVTSTTTDTYSDSSHSSKQRQLPLDILVVDDSPSNRKLLAHLLTRQGHHCTQATDCVEAVEVVRQRLLSATHANEGSLSDVEEGKQQAMFDCILLDYEMPNLNGPGAAKQMRDLGCKSLILGVTGNVLKEDIDLFIKCGANGVLAKPIKMPILKDIWQVNGIGLRVVDSKLSSDHATAA